MALNGLLKRTETKRKEILTHAGDVVGLMVLLQQIMGAEGKDLDFISHMKTIMEQLDGHVKILNRLEDELNKLGNRE